MKQLISATLSKEAAEIYNSWPKQKKSAKISDIICKGDSYLERIIDMQKGINDRNKLISRVIWELNDNPIHKSLCTDLNDILAGSLHQSFD
jgi:hypothetical protein